jgi:hypothetical protein
MNVASSETPGSSMASASVYTVKAADLLFPHGPNTIRVPLISGGTMMYVEAFSPRIWRAAPGAAEGTATASTLWADQIAAYDFRFEGGTPNDPDDLGDVTYTDGQGATTNFIYITTKGAPWAEGDQIWVTMEMTESTWHDDFAAPDVFSPNNRTNELIRPRAEMHNLLLIVDGDWNEVVLDGVAGAATDYRSSRFGAWDSYWRPEAGNAVIGTATGVRAAFDLFGKLRAGQSLGALEPDSDITGQPPLPVRAPSVAVAISPTTYTEGDTFSADNIAVTLTDTGAPALDPATIEKRALVYDAGGVLVAELAPGDAAVTLEAGQRVQARIRWTHVTTAIQTVEVAQVEVSAQTFVPVWVSGKPDGAGLYNGAATRIINAPATVDGVNQHIAFRFRNNHRAIHANSPRIFYALATGGIANDVWLDLENDGDLRLYGAVTPAAYSPVTVRVPNTGSTCSILISVYFDGTGPAELQNSGYNGILIRYQVDGGVVGTQVISTIPKRLFSTQWRIWLYIANSYGTPDVDFQQYYGLWTGGAPTFADFFNSNGTVKQWAANPTRGVAGMTVHTLFSGAGAIGVSGTFNGHLSAGAAAWVEEAL